MTLLTVRKHETPRRVGSRPGQLVQGSAMGPSGGVVDMVTPDTSVFVETVAQVSERQLNEARDYLEHLAVGLHAAGFNVSTEVILSAGPSRAIIDYARTAKPTFIALLRRTHLGLGALFFGSVAKDVVEAEVAPVLFIPPSGR